MKRLLCIIGFTSLVNISAAQTVTLEEYIQKAQDYHAVGNEEQAVTTMEQAVKEYPNSSRAYAKLGDFLSEKSQGYIDMLAILPRAFTMWDKAISLDSGNFEARFSCGTWGVYVPKYMGQLEKAILDLEFVARVLEKSPGIDTQAKLVETYSSLAIGYRKHWEFRKAKETYTRVIKMAPETDQAQRAQDYIDKIIHFEKYLQAQEESREPDSPEIVVLHEKLKEHPHDIDILLSLGNAYLEVGNHKLAREIFEKAINVDSSNVQAYKLLILTLINIFDQGYDPSVSMDHNFLTDLSFNMLNVMDRAISLAPEDIEMRLIRGTAGVEAPFFTGRLEQAITDLQMALESSISDDMKARALYELGRAYQKKAITNWIEVVSDYSNTQSSDFVFNELNPGLKHIDIPEYKEPVVVIDFILGFKDELAPQTALWVEDKDGNFVKTIYVSGFSGYARSIGRVPQWTSSSEFIDADGVTGASIDLGHHIYVWDLKDISGKKVKLGEYIIKVETTFWPSMQYQCAEAPITLRKEADSFVVEEGKLIPYLRVKYLP